MAFPRLSIISLAMAALILVSTGSGDCAISYSAIFPIASVSLKQSPLAAFVRSRSCSTAEETIADGQKRFVQSVIDRIERVSPQQSFPATFPALQDARSEFAALYHKTHHGFVLEIQSLKESNTVFEAVKALAACTSFGTGSRSQLEGLGLYVNPHTHAGIFFSSDAGFYIVQPDVGDHD